MSSGEATGQKALDERSQLHGPTTGRPAVGSRQALPALQLKPGVLAWQKLHHVPVFRVGGLLGSDQRDGSGLGAAEGGQEGGGAGVVAQGGGKTAGGAGGVAVVVEVEMEHRGFGEAGEGVEGTGGHGAGAAALTSATR